MKILPLRQLSDCELRYVLREVSIKSYIRGSRDRSEIEQKFK